MRSSVRRIRWATTERSGTPQINKLVRELVMCCSAVDIKIPRHAKLNDAKDRDPFEVAKERGPLVLGGHHGNEQERRRGGAKPHQQARIYLADGDADQKIGESPDHRHHQKENPPALRHAKSVYRFTIFELLFLNVHKMSLCELGY